MEKFTRLTAVAAPLMRPNIDTDTIVRIERMAGTARHELGPWALESLRYRADGSEDPEFILNREPYRQAQILVAAENFGCGSSRENAVWALAAFGIRAIIAPSYGDIFFGNCFSNGLLPIRLPAVEVEALAIAAGNTEKPMLTVDLEAQRVLTPSGQSHAFEIEPLRRRMLLEGLDPIGLTLSYEKDIAAFQARDRGERPWLWRGM